MLNERNGGVALLVSHEYCVMAKKALTGLTKDAYSKLAINEQFKSNESNEIAILPIEYDYEMIKKSQCTVELKALDTQINDFSIAATKMS